MSKQTAHAALRTIERYLIAEYRFTDDWPLLDAALARVWENVLTNE